MLYYYYYIPAVTGGNPWPAITEEPKVLPG